MREPRSPIMSLGLVALVFGCSPNTKPEADSNSNWLMECEVTADCRGDGTCICGLCTRTCEDDAQCAVVGHGASCVSPVAASSEVACAAIVQAADERVCLAGCGSDAECGSGSRCEAGACWGNPNSVVDTRDAGVDADAGAVLEGGVQPAPVLPAIDAGIDLSTIDATVDFGEPVTPPVPETSFHGESVASALSGVWDEVPGLDPFWGGPMQLVITATPAGVTGTIAFLCNAPVGEGPQQAPGDCPPDLPVGPPTPATDPEVGYPTGIDPIQQGRLSGSILPRTPYRMFDARLEAGRLRFWFTNNDLWSDWCALQTPHPVVVNGRTQFTCMPDAEPCELFFGAAEGDIEGKEALCCAEGTVCRCDAAGCDINYQSGVRSADFSVDGDVMQGFLEYGGDTFRRILQRSPGAQP